MTSRPYSLVVVGEAADKAALEHVINAMAPTQGEWSPIWAGGGARCVAHLRVGPQTIAILSGSAAEAPGIDWSPMTPSEVDAMRARCVVSVQDRMAGGLDGGAHIAAVLGSLGLTIDEEA